MRYLNNLPEPDYSPQLNVELIRAQSICYSPNTLVYDPHPVSIEKMSLYLQFQHEGAGVHKLTYAKHEIVDKIVEYVNKKEIVTMSELCGKFSKEDVEKSLKKSILIRSIDSGGQFITTKYLVDMNKNKHGVWSLKKRKNQQYSMKREHSKTQYTRWFSEVTNH